MECHLRGVDAVNTALGLGQSGKNADRLRLDRRFQRGVLQGVANLRPVGVRAVTGAGRGEGCDPQR